MKLAFLQIGKFILSYNECEFMKSIYKDFYIEKTKNIKYCLNAKAIKDTSELLIMNFKP